MSSIMYIRCEKCHESLHACDGYFWPKLSLEDFVRRHEGCELIFDYEKPDHWYDEGFERELPETLMDFFLSQHYKRPRSSFVQLWLEQGFKPTLALYEALAEDTGESVGYWKNKDKELTFLLKSHDLKREELQRNLNTV